jgi:cytochrome c oxidase assembly protein subunit 15
MIITVTGAAVRLTGSGLGCTDWPTCDVNTELDAPGFHSAIEFGNRMISGLAIIPVIAAFIGARRQMRGLLPLIYLLVVGFIGQVVLGMLVTRTELDPRIVLGHFLLSIVLILLAVLLDHRAQKHPMYISEEDATADSWQQLRLHAWSMVALTSVIIILGTLVTGSGPHTGSEKSGEPIARLGFDIREITRLHSGLIWVFAAVLLWGLWSARDRGPHTPRLIRIFALAALQGALGYLQYFTGVPVLLVAFHITGSVLLFAEVVRYGADATMWSMAVVT